MPVAQTAPVTELVAAPTRHMVAALAALNPELAFLALFDLQLAQQIFGFLLLLLLAGALPSLVCL